MNPGAGAAQPVVVVNDSRVLGASAIPVYGYTSVPTDRSVLGGRAWRVKVIGDSDLVQNGGQYKLLGLPVALPVFTDASGLTEGGTAIPVYPVNPNNWPTNTPLPPSFPPITTGLLLNLQADTFALNDGDFVSTWTDASGLHHNFTQVGVDRPTYMANNNGYPAIYFNSSFMVGSNFADNLPSFTVFYSFYIPGELGSGGTVISKIANGATGIGWNIYSPAGLAYIQDNGGNNGWAVDRNLLDQNAVPYVYAVEKLSNTELHIYQNNVLDDKIGQVGGTGFGTNPIPTFSNAQAVVLGGTGLGAAGGGSYDSRLALPLYAVMIYAPALSPTDRDTMTHALATKWGVTL